MAETLTLALLNSGAISVGTATTVSSAAALLPSIGTVMTAAGAFGSIMSGQQQAAVAKAQASQYALAAKQEELKGREQADNIRRSLQATLATQNAAFAARNISLGSGSAVNLANVSKSQASQDIQTAQFGADMSAAALRGQAGQSMIDASTAKIRGYTGAGTVLANRYGSLIS